MPVTPIYSLPYPGPDEAPDGPDAVENLAVALEAALAALIPNSGVLTNLAMTPGAGWSLLVNEHQVIGKKMWFHLQVERTGSAVTASAAGNIVGDPVLATIDDASKRPTMNCFSAFRGSLTGGSVQVSSATGEVKIADAHSGSSINNGDTVQVYFAYPIP